MSEYRLLHGDALAVLKTLPSESVHMVCTSPPYFGLRDYSTATWEGGDPACDHQVGRFITPASDTQRRNNGSGTLQARDVCPKCGARRVDLQLGLEDTPDAYVARLVEVFREVRRVLHKTGTCWINIGDSYNGSGGGHTKDAMGKAAYDVGDYPANGRNVNGLGPKQLLGVPWRVAFALQADGWVLRSEIIWHKKAPMPESVTDRPTKAHEQVFLLAKSASYYYDATAIAEPAVGNTPANVTHKHQNGGGIVLGRKTNPNSGLMNMGAAVTRNRRSVWTLGPEQFPGSHFATMPTKLVEPCILAGSSAHGACANCGSPYERVVERGNNIHPGSSHNHAFDREQGNTQTHASGKPAGTIMAQRWYAKTPDVTTGWVATCTCGADVIPCTVLDPFSGAGTTGYVALRHHRHYIGIDLNSQYNDLARRRFEQVQPTLFSLETT